MKTELILIAMIALLTSFSAFAQERSAAAGEGYQEGLCTTAQRRG